MYPSFASAEPFSGVKRSLISCISCG